MRLTATLVILAAVSIWSTSAEAATSGKGAEEHYLMPTGAGISDPSVLMSSTDNPAVSAMNNRTKLQLLVIPSATFTPVTGGLHLMMGNGIVGGHVGVSMSVPGASSPSVLGGIGVNIKAIKTAVGLSCQVGLTGSISVFCSGVGLLINPNGPFRVGLQLGLAGLTTGGSFPIGAGVAVDLGKIITLDLDAATAIGGGTGGFNLMPAMSLHIAFFELMGGYSFNVLSSTTGSNALMAGGPTAGAGFLIGKSVHLMGLYNHGGTYVASFTVRF